MESMAAGNEPTNAEFTADQDGAEAPEVINSVDESRVSEKNDEVKTESRSQRLRKYGKAKWQAGSERIKDAAKFGEEKYRQGRELDAEINEQVFKYAGKAKEGVKQAARVGKETYHKGRELDDRINKKVFEYSGKAKDTAVKGFQEVRRFKEGLHVDVNKARQDASFQKFLGEINASVNWLDREKHGDIKELYVRYERATKIREAYNNLYEGKLAKLVENPGRAKDEIEAKILEMAEHNPDGLRSLEKQILRVEKSQKQMAEKQRQIDVYAAEGGKEGLQDKMETLKKANSRWNTFYKYTLTNKLFGWGEDLKLAKRSAAVEHGLTDRKAIKREIKDTQGDIKTINRAEKSKDKIRIRYADERAQVLVENDIAKTVFKQVEESLQGKMKNLGKAETLEDVKEIQEVMAQLREEFMKEGVTPTLTGKTKLRELEFNGRVITEEDMQKLDRELIKRRKALAEKELEERVRKTPPHYMDQLVEQTLKRWQFAGNSQRESARESFKIFTKLLHKMPQNTLEFIKLSLALSEYKYLTA